MFYLIFSYSLVVILLAIYFKKKNLFSNFTGDKHQLFSNKKNIPLVGGFFLLFPLILTNFNNTFFIILLILIFSIGLFSDRKILISPKKRFLFQLALVLLSVNLLDLQILSTKLNFFDNFLENSIFNIFLFIDINQRIKFYRWIKWSVINLYDFCYFCIAEARPFKCINDKPPVNELYNNLYGYFNFT